MGAAWEVEKHGQERSVRSEGQGLGEKHHGIFKLCNTKKNILPCQDGGGGGLWRSGGVGKKMRFAPS